MDDILLKDGQFYLRISDPVADGFQFCGFHDMKFRAVIAILRVNKGNVGKTARDLHIARRTLQRWIVRGWVVKP